jgi:hypothetical protein
MIRLWPGDKAGSSMFLDNVSLREAGNLLPVWTKRNINPAYQQSNGSYVYKVEKGKAIINISNEAFGLKAVSPAKTEFIILSSAIKPLTKYELSFKLTIDKADKMNISVQTLDIDKKQIGKTINISGGNGAVSTGFTTPEAAVWCKIIINLENGKGSEFMLTAPVLRETEKQDS